MKDFALERMGTVAGSSIGGGAFALGNGDPSEWIHHVVALGVILVGVGADWVRDKMR